MEEITIRIYDSSLAALADRAQRRRIQYPTPKKQVDVSVESDAFSDLEQILYNLSVINTVDNIGVEVIDAKDSHICGHIILDESCVVYESNPDLYMPQKIGNHCGMNDTDFLLQHEL